MAVVAACCLIKSTQKQHPGTVNFSDLLGLVKLWIAENGSVKKKT